VLDTTKRHLSSCFNNLIKLLPWQLWHGSLLQHRCYSLLCPSAVSLVNFKSIMISFSSSFCISFHWFWSDCHLKRGHNFASIISLGYSSTRPLRNWLLSRDALSTFTLCSSLWRSAGKEEILYNLVNMVLSNIKLPSVETWWSWWGAVMAINHCISWSWWSYSLWVMTLTWSVTAFIFFLFFCGLASSDATTMTFRVFFWSCSAISFPYIYIYVDVGLDTVSPTLYTRSRISLHLCVQ